MAELKEKKVLLSDIKDKTSVSARVNSYIIEQYKESEIPISLVIESSLIYFMKLSDDEKIKFINNNLTEKVKINEIKKPKKVWKDMLSEYFDKLDIPASISSELFSGLTIGAVALIGGMLAALGNKNFFDDDKE